MQEFKYSQLKEVKDILRAAGVCEEFLESEVAVREATAIISPYFCPIISNERSTNRRTEAEEYIKKGDSEKLKDLLSKIGISVNFKLVRQNVSRENGPNSVFREKKKVGILRDGSVFVDNETELSDHIGSNVYCSERYFNSYGLDMAARFTDTTTRLGRVNETTTLVQRDDNNPAKVHLHAAMAVYGEIEGKKIATEMVEHKDTLVAVEEPDLEHSQGLPKLLELPDLKISRGTSKEHMEKLLSADNREANINYLNVAMQQFRKSYENATKNVDGRANVAFAKIKDEPFQNTIAARTNGNRPKIGIKTIEKMYKDYRYDISTAKKSIEARINQDKNISIGDSQQEL